ncbi:group 1 truncated hemoglobin [Caballeronia sp. LZ062]|uniref:group I truncated hemoglobin n=1 Tax=unclassified Caballeronia TaxID=2646786 RepID=UPI002859F11F|nr:MULTISPECIES: group 1 truncated hemoglobin [unclassified Caballeronia]MDR5856418.1 group 1 truncated hemoglobin [Caballeronia sp. LZ050]MDR5873088.1 group 1 truncated hemoglobin [Caballeronia sp. LZ062]
MIKLRHAALAVCAFAAFSGTAHATDDTLYRQFGEQAGLVRIVDDLYTNVLADPRTAPYFENAPIKRIKTKLVEQFCVLLGGPCEYTGRPMRRTHEGQNIDRAAFNALVEDLQAAMDKNGVPFHAQNKLLAKLAPMYRDVQDRE